MVGGRAWEVKFASKVEMANLGAESYMPGEKLEPEPPLLCCSSFGYSSASRATPPTALSMPGDCIACCSEIRLP